MEKLYIRGGRCLNGEVSISGAKNAVLPILAATLLTDQCVTINNVPHLHDVTTTINLLRQMGVSVLLKEHMSLEVQADAVENLFAPYEIVRTMRASMLVLGPMLARYGRAKVSLPGGCAIGLRPVNMHLDALRKMGAEVEIVEGYIEARVKGRFKGTRVKFDRVTVTGTENLLMASTLGKGTTIIENAACEPEVVDLANCLNRMGAQIEGQGTSLIVIHGCPELGGCSFDVLPDRIETATFLTAGAMTGGHVKVKKARADLIGAVLAKLDECGAHINIDGDSIELQMNGHRPKCADVTTAPYPAFPTDMQAQFTSLNAIGEGVGTITETVFENRFMHALEMQRMGADISILGNRVVVRGKKCLKGAAVMATDLRASASLVLAGLVADGETIVDRIYHIDRGYECIEEKLLQLGADVQRLSN